MKQLLSIVFVLTLLVSFVPMQAYAETSGDYTYTLDSSGNATITEYSGAGVNLTIPGTLSGHPVAVIAKNVFCDNENLKSVVIPNGVTTIADATPGAAIFDGAFSGCINLTSATLPNTLTYIGSFAFQGCKSLKSINFPTGITAIGEYAFQSCEALATAITLQPGLTRIGNDAFGNCPKVTSITLPNTLTTIGTNAFMSCVGLTSITIPSSVTLLDDGSPFYHCYKLTAIHVDPKNLNYASDAGVLFNKDKTTIMQYPSSKAGTSYTMPNGVTKMDNSCFMYSRSLKTVNFPNTLTNIGDGAFLNCSGLTSLFIPNSVTFIDYCAFRSCTSLTSVSIPPSVESTGGDIFRNCTQKITISGVASSHAQVLAAENGYTFKAVNASVFMKPAPAPAPVNTLVAVPSATKMVVNGANVAVDAYRINGNNYIMLRDLAVMVNNTGKNFNVTWDSVNKAINLLSITPYTIAGGEMKKGDGSSKSASPTTSKIYIDGRQVALTAYYIGQNNYFKLRDVMQAFNIAVGYDNVTKTATLDTSSGYVPD